MKFELSFIENKTKLRIEYCTVFNCPYYEKKTQKRKDGCDMRNGRCSIDRREYSLDEYIKLYNKSKKMSIYNIFLIERKKCLNKKRLLYLMLGGNEGW